MTTSYTDQELQLRYAKDKNKTWLGIALDRYTIVLLGVCMKYVKDEEEAKDIVQQVFIKALAILETQTIENLGGWLYRVAKNECLDILRKRATTHHSEDGLQHLADDELDIEAHIEQEKNIKKLLEAITSLKEEQKICIELFYLEQKSYHEIVALTNFDLKQVKSNIQNGKRNLKLKLEQ